MVLSLTRGWTSFWLITTVCGRKRSMLARTWGRMPGEVMRTGISPIWAAFSKACWTPTMNCCRREGAMAGARALPLGAQGDERQVAVGAEIGGAELAGEARADMLGDRLGGAAGAGDLGDAF